MRYLKKKLNYKRAPGVNVRCPQESKESKLNWALGKSDTRVIPAVN